MLTEIEALERVDYALRNLTCSMNIAKIFCDTETQMSSALLDQ